jgi:CubicO group peptidase (beta-lactamase class C family)
MAALHAAATRLMRGAAAPGLSLAVVRRDGVVQHDALGMAELAPARPTRPDTAYLWFSLTKIATATAAMRLADEGRLELDAPCGEYVDHPRLRPAGPTTLQLLTHTSGLANPVPIRWVHPADAPPPEPGVLLRRLLDRRGAFRSAPGTRAQYSNVGYLLAAQVIAAAAGVPFEQYVHEAVLAPAGMQATGFSYPAGTVATGYVRAPRSLDPLLRLAFPRGTTGPRHGRDLSLAPFLVDGAGYGGLVGPVLDAARLLRLHLGDGELDGVRVLAPATARRMRRIAATGKRFAHGIGWFRRLGRGSGEDYVEHFGSGAGFSSVMRAYPDRGLGIVVMTNGTRGYDIEPLLASTG